MKKDRTKELLLEQLKKTPIVQACCEKLGISRSSYYRWCEQDPEFEKALQSSLLEGQQLVSDLAESELIGSIRDGNMKGIIFWLKNHRDTYKQKLEIQGQIKSLEERLSPEQEYLFKQAMKMSSLITEENIKKLDNQNNHEIRKEDAGD